MRFLCQLPLPLWKIKQHKMTKLNIHMLGLIGISIVVLLMVAIGAVRKQERERYEAKLVQKSVEIPLYKEVYITAVLPEALKQKALGAQFPVSQILAKACIYTSFGELEDSPEAGVAIALSHSYVTSYEREIIKQLKLYQYDILQ